MPVEPRDAGRWRCEVQIERKKPPAPVPARTTQGGAAQPDEWAWVERSVWTEWMLEALDRGVKGGVRSSLDCQRWPNAYFEEHGLLSLRAAHRTLLQFL